MTYDMSKDNRPRLDPARLVALANHYQKQRAKIYRSGRCPWPDSYNILSLEKGLVVRLGSLEGFRGVEVEIEDVDEYALDVYRVKFVGIPGWHECKVIELVYTREYTRNKKAREET